MKIKLIALCSVVIFFCTISLSQGQTIVGVTSICPDEWHNYGMNDLPSHCSIRSWSANSNKVILNDNGTTAALACADIGAPGTFELSAAVTCTTGSGSEKDPYVYTNTTYQVTITVNGVGEVTLTPSINNLTCGPEQTFTVTASSANANQYNWGVIGGSIVTQTNSNTVVISKPACENSIIVTCNAYRQECLGYPGESGSYTIKVGGVNLPNSISGPDGLCATGPNSSASYHVAAGPNSCWTYNWYFNPADPGLSITNPNSPNPTISVTGPTNSGFKYLKCDVAACGKGKTIGKRISICQDDSPPSNIYASQAGNTCYHQFNASGTCGSTWEWQINNGPIQSTINPFIALFETGFYTVKVRVINACGTSGWRTKTFNLQPISNNPPCMWKTDPNATYQVPSDESLAAGLQDGLTFDMAPNPGQSDQEISIDCSEELVGGVLEVYNIAGSKLMERGVNHTSFSFPISKLGGGLYFFRIRHGDLLVARKFVVTN